MKKPGVGVAIFFMLIAPCYILFDWLKYDTLTIVDNPGFNLLMGSFVSAMMWGLVILLIVSLILLFRHFKTNKLLSLAPILSMLFVASYIYILYFSSFYVHLSYKMNLDHRMEAVQMYEDGTLPQINMNTYLVPHRLSSQNGKVYIYEDGEAYRAYFIISFGATRRELMYSSKDGTFDQFTLSDYESTLEKKETEKIDDHWYCIEYC